MKRQGRDVNRSPSSDAEVRNVWRYTSVPPYVMSWLVQANLFTYLLT